MDTNAIEIDNSRSWARFVEESFSLAVLSLLGTDILPAEEEIALKNAYNNGDSNLMSEIHTFSRPDVLQLIQDAKLKMSDILNQMFYARPVVLHPNLITAITRDEIDATLLFAFIESLHRPDTYEPFIDMLGNANDTNDYADVIAAISSHSCAFSKRF